MPQNSLMFNSFPIIYKKPRYTHSFSLRQFLYHYAALMLFCCSELLGAIAAAKTLVSRVARMASSARLDLHAVELAIMALFVIMATACYCASYRLIPCFVLCHENFLLDLFALRIYSLCSQIQNLL